jgi:hypothetical protein
MIQAEKRVMIHHSAEEALAYLYEYFGIYVHQKES